MFLLYVILLNPHPASPKSKKGSLDDTEILHAGFGGGARYRGRWGHGVDDLFAVCGHGEDFTLFEYEIHKDNKNSEIL